MDDVIIKYSCADIVKTRLYLNPIIGEKFAAIITFSAGIENFLELGV